MKTAKHIKKCVSNNGFTLIEIIVSFAIIGIIAVTFISTFTSGIQSIFIMGQKTSAVNDAQAFLEAVYEDYNVDIGDTDSNIYKLSASRADLDVSRESDLSTFNTGLYNPNNPNNKLFYIVEDVTINGKVFRKISVLMFYHNGKELIKLSSIIP